MFDVGFWELMILFTLALLVLGPERLPRVTNSIGRWVGRARAMASNLKEQIEDEVSLTELEKLHSMDEELDLSSFTKSTQKHDAPDTPDSDSEEGSKQEEAPQASEENSKTDEPA